MTVNVLLVDDEERFLSTTATLLEKQGMNALTASSGGDALRMLCERKNIDVVILDIKMPGMDGIEVLRQIAGRYPLVKVILLTGHASVETAISGMQLGAFDYVLKPCDIHELMHKVFKAFQLKRASDERIMKAKIDSIISNPMAVFEKDTIEE